MALTKKISKKAPAKKALIVKSERVPLDQLRVYHKNPRIGDLDTIAKSLDKNGQYRSIVVNIGTNAKYKNEILAGNHTYKAAKRLGWTDIQASFVDVDDDRARAIVLADNKTAENGTYDEQAIGQLLAEVDDVMATGFSQDEADKFIEQAGAQATAAMESLEESGAFDVDFSDDGTSEGGGTSFYGSLDPDDEEDDDDDEDRYDDDGNFIAEAGEESSDTAELTDRPSDLLGVNDLVEDLPEDKSYWNGALQLPKLRSDMFVKPKDLPEKLLTWAGSATRDIDDDEVWWHYPWGGDSTRGLKHLDQVIVSFYSWDDTFDNWYWTPNKYAAKLLNSGIKMAITPNWSMWDTQSRFLNLFSLYRNLYVSRYLQEVGIKTIQCLQYPYGDMDFLTNYIFRYIPKNQKVYSRQMQTWNSKEVKGEQEEVIKRMERTMLDHYQPEVLLLYGVRTGRRWFNENIAPHYPNMKVIELESRLELLSDWKRDTFGKTGRKATI